MKYIKLFEQYNGLEDNIKAALVELEDLGFTIQTNFYLNDDKPVLWEREKIEIRIIKPGADSRLQPYLYSDVSDVVDTLSEYLVEIWGSVTKTWRVYGYHQRSNPNWKTQPTGRSGMPYSTTSVLDIELHLSGPSLK